MIEFALRMYQLKRHVMNQPFEIFLENEWKLNLKSKQLAVEIKESPNIDIPLYKKIKTGIDISVPKSFPCWSCSKSCNFVWFMRFYANHAILFKSCYFAQIVGFWANRAFFYKSCNFIQIVRFLANRAFLLRLCSFVQIVQFSTNRAISCWSCNFVCI